MEKNPGAAPTSSPDEEKGRREEQEAVALKKGPWTAAEDAMLMDHVQRHGEGNWNAVQRMTGLLRCGKSCRLRWTNHLRPNLKKGSFTPDEEIVIAQLHAQFGNKWARMAAHLPGRTDNEIKNYWNTRTKRRQRAGLPVYPPEVQLHLALSKRCRYDEFSPLAPPPLSSETGSATSSAGYTSARPAPLDLARQLAMGTTTNQTVQFLSPPPLSAPSSPWIKSLARNAHFIQFAHSSPSTPTGPLHPVTPDLSLGYGAQSGFSPSRGPRVELPSNQFGHQALPMPPSSASATTASSLDGQPDQPNAASLEKMLQELHEAIKVDPPAANGGTGDAVQERHDGREDKPEGQLKDDIDTLFDLMIPPFNAAEPAPGAPAPNHSGSISQQSSEDQDHGVDHLPAAGAISSPDQEWTLDGVCQWTDVSRIC
ncbi:hypothetical protein QOZ80_3AG0227570 [Eleusine coracana subsp. coracana]|nr:hypothetical protein QOZ80_3AG0227570 [Eleusine coracana subsp. coracana]